MHVKLDSGTLAPLLKRLEKQGLTNLVPVKFTDGAYYNFPESQKIRDGITFIKAKGHMKGNSIVIVEMDGLFYMIHGDITYVDEALYENKLSVVFDDIEAARESLDWVREFVRNHPTVYLSTHSPQGYENLEAKRVEKSALFFYPKYRAHDVQWTSALRRPKRNGEEGLGCRQGNEGKAGDLKDSGGTGFFVGTKIFKKILM